MKIQTIFTFNVEGLVEFEFPQLTESTIENLKLRK